MDAHQGSQTVRDFSRYVQYIRVKWLDHGIDPEETSLKRLMKWAVRFEIAKEAVANQGEEPSLSEESDNDKKPSNSEKSSDENKSRSKKTKSHKASFAAMKYSYLDTSSSDELVLSKMQSTSDFDSEADTTEQTESDGEAKDSDTEEAQSHSSFD
jgi:hypothetical protein